MLLSLRWIKGFIVVLVGLFTGVLLGTENNKLELYYPIQQNLFKVHNAGATGQEVSFAYQRLEERMSFKASKNSFLSTQEVIFLPCHKSSKVLTRKKIQAPAAKHQDPLEAKYFLLLQNVGSEF